MTLQPWNLGEETTVVSPTPGELNAAPITAGGGLGNAVPLSAGTRVRVVAFTVGQYTDVEIVGGALAGQRFRMLANSYLARTR
jgi:hypothetical protein